MLAMLLAMSSTACAVGLLQSEWSFTVLLGFTSFKLLRKAVASACAGLREFRMSSNSCTTPCVGSCRDCVKLNRSESLTGRFKTCWGQSLGG